MWRRLLKIFCAFAFLCAQTAAAEPSYHLVGWTNFFLPGGGKLLMDQYRFAGEQFLLEVGAFGWGYSLSARKPFTLDGVPEDLPSPEVGIFQKPTVSTICTKRSSNGTCLTYRTTKSNSSVSYDSTTTDITQPLLADWLQELGLKAHMVNIYDAYREAAKKQGVNFTTAQIDPTPTRELFLEPFKADNLLDTWVWLPLVVTTGALVYSYATINPSDYPGLPQFTYGSRALYSATYLGVYPVGSAAPEEMFYRGFIQGEVHALTRTNWVSVPVSTTLYALSHESGDQLAAAVSGLFLGILTAHEDGRLRLGVTYHFWSDILTGIYSIALIKLQQKNANVQAPSVNMNFTF